MFVVNMTNIPSNIIDGNNLTEEAEGKEPGVALSLPKGSRRCPELVEGGDNPFLI